jgi:hypothetical protein
VDRGDHRIVLLSVSTQLGLIGVFPYSAIDMGTYETLKTTYCRSAGVDEPPVFAVLSFGALSGSIGAASVYRELARLDVSHPDRSNQVP